MGYVTAGPPWARTSAPVPEDYDEPQPRLASFLFSGLAVFLQQLGEMFELAIRLVVVGVRRPVGFWREVYAQMYETLRTSWLLLVFSTFVFGFGAPGLQGAASFQRLGMQDRLGTYFVMAGVRGFVPWLNAIVIAGAVGTRLIADLGSRRVRQEFDALEVMGIDPVHDVLLPRVIGLTVMTALLSVLAMALGIVSGVAAAAATGASTASFLDQFWTAVSAMDMLAALGKATLFGLIISVVCAHMGYRAEGGPTGVGRAVNFGVVAAFAGVWVVNLVVTTLLLGLHPQLYYAR